jgi:hypothetical protein
MSDEKKATEKWPRIESIGSLEVDAPNEDALGAYVDAAKRLMSAMMPLVDGMLKVGAWPEVMVAAQEGGNIVILPIEPMPSEKVGEILQSAADAVNKGTLIKSLSEVPMPNGDCDCPNCQAKRGFRRMAQAAGMPEHPPEATPVPAKGGIH